MGLYGLQIDNFSFLAKCKNLRNLDLQATNFTDCSLLAELPKLEYVYLPVQKALENIQVLNTLSAKIKLEDPFYYDEDFINMIVLEAKDICLPSYKGISKVQYVEVNFIEKVPSVWRELLQKERNWTSLESEIAEEMAKQLADAILHGNVRDLMLSFETWGEGHYLTIDFSNRWAAPMYMDDDKQIYYNFYNNAYKSVEILAPVDIGGQSPVPKMFALEDMELVRKIVLYFLETGKFYPETQWVKSGV